MNAKCEKQVASIALVGTFTPTIFHPSWFANQRLLPQEQCDHAEVEIVHPTLARFYTSWFGLEVTDEVLEVTIDDTGALEQLRALLMEICKRLIGSRLETIKISFESHYTLDSVSHQRRFFQNLNTRGDWGEVIDEPELQSLVIHGKRPDDTEGYIKIVAEPSDYVSDGVCLLVSDHFELRDEENELAGMEQAIRILQDRWAESTDRSCSVAERIMAWGDAQ